MKKTIVRAIALILGSIACIFLSLMSPYLIPGIIRAVQQTAAYQPVEQRALDAVQDILSMVSGMTDGAEVPDYFGGCYTYAHDSLVANDYQYQLTLKAVYDSKDSRFTAPEKPVDDYWDATVSVHFPDGREVELYFWERTWTDCTITTVPTPTIDETR